MIFEPMLTANLGKMTLSGLLSIPYGILVFLVVIIAFTTFFFLGKIEGKLYKIKQ